MARGSNAGVFLNKDALKSFGLSANQIRKSIVQTNDLLDSVDRALLDHGVGRLSETVELANLSSMLGNIFAAAVAEHSAGRLERNGPHKYPDLLSSEQNFPDIEVKFALEKNKPKGHLVKVGHYLTCRYVLCDEHGQAKFEKGNRGTIPWVWEVRCGLLKEEHFTESNTEGDSGKTAVVNAEGMEALKIVYLDENILPYTHRSRIRKELTELVAQANHSL